MRHAELLTLLAATWLIIEPPWKVDEPDEYAPLGRWKQYAKFKSKAECDRYLRKKIDDARNAELVVWCETGKLPPRLRVGEAGDTCARCISADEFKQLKSPVDHPR